MERLVHLHLRLDLRDLHRWQSWYVSLFALLLPHSLMNVVLCSMRDKLVFGLESRGIDFLRDFCVYLGLPGHRQRRFNYSCRWRVRRLVLQWAADCGRWWRSETREFEKFHSRSHFESWFDRVWVLDCDGLGSLADDHAGGGAAGGQPG